MKDLPPVTETPLGRIIGIVGPTASGKSGVALELSLLVGGEVVSVDSMQVYRGMNIGTAKPTVADQNRVKHHLIDLLDLDRSFDAASFRDTARAEIHALLEDRKTPVLCGGTGLYFAALRHGLGAAPPGSQALRMALDEASLEELLDELRRRDPGSYSKVDRQNRRRVIRAVEVVRLSGKPFSQQQAEWPRLEAGRGQLLDDGWKMFGLAREPGDLSARIQARVEEMFQGGLIQETEQLLEAGLEKNPTAMQAIGYRQVVEYLRGQYSLAETRERIQLKTRQLAKRQMTWFRRQMEVRWLNIAPGDTALEIAQRIARLLVRE